MSKEKILLISEIKPEQEHFFTDTGADIFKPADIGIKINPADITIIYGWKPNPGNKILYARNSKLKWIHAISAGVDYLPLEELAERNIKLTNASGIHAEAISQSVLTYILYFVRKIDVSQSDQHIKHWADRDENTPHVVSDFKYAIFGTGHIGSQIARLIKAFGGTTIGINTSGHPAENFDETFGIHDIDEKVLDADIFVNVMPLTTETSHYFDTKFFQRAQSIFLFINVGRGPVVSSSDLISAINNGIVKHAALDVFEEEPLPKDSPFWTVPNTLITPHNTGVIQHFKQAQVNLFIPNLQQFIESGTFKYNEVNISKGY